MRELAVQGINDTNGTQDRAYLQLEVDALMEEINRVASDTQYNGKSVLSSLANTVDGSGNITAYGGQIQEALTLTKRLVLVLIHRYGSFESFCRWNG